MSRRNVTHGTAIEDIFGYSTGTRYGREVYVAGQLARDSDGNQIASTALSDKFARVAANIHDRSEPKLAVPRSLGGELSWVGTPT